MGKVTKGKNTVTVLYLLFAIILLFVVYVWRVETEINPVSVPYAKVQIEPGQQITKDMVGVKQIPPSMLKPGKVLDEKDDIIGKYANADTIIPKGSIFYERTVVEQEQLPTSLILNYQTGYVLYNMPVNTISSYGNTIYPGNYIDVMLEARTALNDQIKSDKLLSNVKVLAVKDETGKSVFSNLDNERTAALIIFAVPEEHYNLLKKAENLRGYTSVLLPRPTNEGQKETPGNITANETLKTWVEQTTTWTN